MGDGIAMGHGTSKFLGQRPTFFDAENFVCETFQYSMPIKKLTEIVDTLEISKPTRRYPRDFTRRICP